MSQRAWLTLAGTPSLSGAAGLDLARRFGGVQSMLEQPAAELIAAGLTRAQVDALREAGTVAADEAQRWQDAPDRHVLTIDDPAYPALLAELRDPPLVLFVRGQCNALSLPQLAIVGSRNATPGGIANARAFASCLAQGGFSICSGLAVGIDAAAHTAALEAGGQTVAVCATGLEHIYPRQHAGLADAIAEQGAVIAESFPSVGPQRFLFPRRNRIISGLSLGTLVVEAGSTSGALITARLAAEQNREVFAIPGSIHNPVARGCHRLIRGGAKLVETADDIVSELSGALDRIAASIEQNASIESTDAGAAMNPEHQRLLDSMGWDPISVNELVSRSGLTAEEVSSMLLILELDQRVDSLSGGRYQQREEGRR